MTVVALLPVFVFVAGLLIYFFCVGISRSSMTEVGKTMFAVGLLAFLLSSSAQSCSMSAGGGGGSAQHR
jgi:hypothetical protein